MPLKKSILILFFVAGVTLTGISQNAFYDARSLAEPGSGRVHEVDDSGKIILSHTSEVYSILNRYVEGPPNVDPHTAIQRAFNTDNPFVGVQGGQESGISVSAITEPVRSLSNLNVTTIADGLARFLIERSRKELAITFFGRFEQVFERYPEIQVLFPHTARYIEVFETYQYSAMLGAFREGFKKDLDQLPANLKGLKNVEIERLNEEGSPVTVRPYQEFFNSTEGLLFQAGLDLVDPIRQGVNASEIIGMLGTSTHLAMLEGKHANIHSFVRFGNVVSQSLLNNDETSTWVPVEQLRRLLNNRTAFRIYLGLIYQNDQSADIDFEISGERTTLRELLASGNTAVQSLHSYFVELSSAFQQINQAIAALQKVKESGGPVSPQALRNYLSSVADLIEDFGRLKGYLGVGFPADDEFATFMALGRQALILYEDLHAKSYLAAVLDAAVLLNSLGDSGITFQKDLVKYGTFMAAVAEADNSEEVKQAIESMVLPPGSSRIKRESTFDVSLNAYLGGFYGREWLRSTGESSMSYGAWAPVGISISKGLYRVKERGGYSELGSLSLYLTMIDIGAFASFRMGNDQVAELPKVTLQNLFAPGAFLSYGIPDTPLSLGFGYQTGPQLREIDSGPGSSAYRWLATFSVDIPLMNLKVIPRR